jgi:hypothetical protein
MGLAAQVPAPLVVVVVRSAGSGDGQAVEAAIRATYPGGHVISLPAASAAEGKNAGVEAALGSTSPLGFLFIDHASTPMPGCLAALESTLRHCPEVGLVSGWVQRTGTERQTVVAPCPAFPYQWLWNDVASCVAVRAEALHEAGPVRSGMDDAYESWDLANAVMTAGWAAVTYPAILIEERFDGKAHRRSAPDHARMRQELLSRVPDLAAQDAQRLLALQQSVIRSTPAAWPLVRGAPAWVTAELSAGLRDHLVRVRAALRDPVRAARRVAWIIRRAVRRGTRRIASNKADRRQ